MDNRGRKGENPNMTAKKRRALTLGKMLNQWRTDAGYKTLDRAAVHVSERLGRSFSRETLRRWEADEVEPARLDPLPLVVLLDLYGKSISDLPDPARTVVLNARELFASASPWITANPSDLLVCAVSAA